MSAFHHEKVLSVHHWTDRLFSFRTTRTPTFRFRSGQFVMMGLPSDGKPLLRAYSLASAHYDDALEFFSIKVPERAFDLAPATPQGRGRDRGRPQADRHAGDRQPPTRPDAVPARHRHGACAVPQHHPRPRGLREIRPDRRGARRPLDRDLAYSGYLQDDLPKDELIGELVREKLIYYPTVTREPFRHNGRLSAALASDRLATDNGLPRLDPKEDRFMLCGSPAMLAEVRALLDARGFEEGNHGEPGDYVIEKAFVDK